MTRSTLALTMFMLILTVACATPTTPSATPAQVPPIPLTYAINVPTLAIATAALVQYPNGIHLAPVAAQAQYDYSAVYGAPNVYYGPAAPTTAIYRGVGIVVAPLAIASVPTFAASDWPDASGQPFGGSAPTQQYVWLGRFVFTPMLTVQP